MSQRLLGHLSLSLAQCWIAFTLGTLFLTSPARPDEGCYDSHASSNNLGQLKEQLKSYHHGAYAEDIGKVLDQAKKYLIQQMESVPKPTKPAIVLDIDETSLSNWKQMEQDDFGYFPKGDCPMETGTPTDS
jgi:putative acid phosphatase of HAD superfamily subfamily IIIB